MTVSLAGFSPEIQAIIQDNTLRREFMDALFPILLFRDDAAPEVWQAKIGDEQIFTRTGLMEVNDEPLTPGNDPDPQSYGVEQWRAIAVQLSNSLDTNLPTNYQAIASTLLKDTRTLGMNAGQTINRKARNSLFRPYLGGNTTVMVAATSGDFQVVVSSINGFTERMVNGRLSPVGAAAPIAIEFSAGAVANTVVGAVPLVAANPYGPGVLTLGAALSGNVARRAGVYSEFRPTLIRAGGGTTIDGITGSSRIALQDIINAVAQLRDDNVPTHPDGLYHVHIGPTVEAQLFADDAFENLNTSLVDGMRYRELVIGDLVGARFFRNTEAPKRTNVGTLVATGNGIGQAVGAPKIGAEVTTDLGVNVNRTIVTGGGALRELFIPEGSAYVSDAGVTGEVGGFQVTTGGVTVNAERVRYILRAPLDRLQQVVSQSWSWSGDFTTPSDSLTDGPSTYKRACVIESA